MPEILTNNFKTDINRMFLADVKANEEYYMFVSTIGNFNPVDSAVSTNEFLENTLFGKRINNDDINFMIKYYPWQKGSSYAQYDDTLDLDGLKFYAVVGPNDNDTGDYRIYKCIDNSQGGTAQSPPTFDAANVTQIYETADGYIWKYMYRLTTLQFEAYNALGYIPIDPSANTNPTEILGGGISDVEISNPFDNQGYNLWNGYLTQAPRLETSSTASTEGLTTLFINPSEDNWPQTINTLTGQYIYITNPSSAITNLFKLEYYEYNTNTGNVEVRVKTELANPDRGNVTGATQANPVVITSVGHNLEDGQPVNFTDVLGMTEINDLTGDGTPTYYVDVLTADTFALHSSRSYVNDVLQTLNTPVNGTGFGAYTSGGVFTSVKTPTKAGVVFNASVQIFPRIDIKGDGVGAVAIPTISNGKITKTVVLNRGQDYNNITATVVDPSGFNPADVNRTDVRAVARAIIEPGGGHAYSLLDEFKCKHFSFYGYVTADDNTNIGGVNTYGAIGIVRSPQFRQLGAGWRSGVTTGVSPAIFDNRIAIVTNDYERVTANSVITQTDGSNEITFTAQVHEVDATANTVYLAEYMGPNKNLATTGNGDTSFNPNLPIRSDSGQLITINNPVADNVVYSDYIQRTGEVYFMEDFFPLARTELSREEFKFVLEF